MWERHQRMLVWGRDLVLLPREERQKRWKRKCGKRGGKIQQKVLDELQLPFQICLALVSRLGVLSRVQTHNQAANSQSEWASSRPRGAKLKVLKNYLDIFGYWSKKQNWSSVVHWFMKYRPLRFSEKLTFLMDCTKGQENVCPSLLLCLLIFGGGLLKEPVTS